MLRKKEIEVSRKRGQYQPAAITSFRPLWLPFEMHLADSLTFESSSTSVSLGKTRLEVGVKERVGSKTWKTLLLLLSIDFHVAQQQCFTLRLSKKKWSNRTYVRLLIREREAQNKGTEVLENTSVHCVQGSQNCWPSNFRVASSPV